MAVPKEQVELGAVRAVEAYGSGLLTALRNNATAYGFSISITASYGMVSVAHPKSLSVLQTALFAAGAALAFAMIGVTATHLVRRMTRPQSERALIMAGTFDLVSIVAAVGIAAACSQIPGAIAWVITAFATSLIYFLVGGLDVLVAHRAARRSEAP